MLKVNGFTLLLCFISVFFQFQGTAQSNTTTPAPTTPTPTTTTSTPPPVATNNPSSGSVHNTTQGTTAASGKTTPQPDIGDVCPGGSCKGELICDTSCKIAAGNNCTTGPGDHCQNGTTCISATSAYTCTVDAGFVGSDCTNSTSCTVENSYCSSGKCQCKPRYDKVAATLECKSGSATVMASVLVLAVAFVKTQLF